MSIWRMLEKQMFLKSWRKHCECILERRCEVFSERELKGLDRGYFNIIMANDYDLTLMSKNTGHYWYLHNPEYPEEGTVIIFHRHNGQLPYHLHSKSSTLSQAVKQIKAHDAFQLNGRRPVRR